MVKIIGHRGASGLEPENTLRSFKKAIELSVDYVECDVHATKDGHLILMHDSTVDRTTNGKGPVNSFTFDEIRRLDAGKGEKVPTLQELLELSKGKVKLHVELKDETAVEAVVQLIESKKMESEVFLTSGNTDVLRRVRSLNYSIPTEHIFGAPPEDAIERAVDAGAKRVSCHHKHLNENFVKGAHEHGLEVVAWPPNTLEEMKRAIEFGVDLITTDRPDIALEIKSLSKMCGKS